MLMKNSRLFWWAIKTIWRKSIILLMQAPSHLRRRQKICLVTQNGVCGMFCEKYVTNLIDLYKVSRGNHQEDKHQPDRSEKRVLGYKNWHLQRLGSSGRKDFHGRVLLLRLSTQLFLKRESVHFILFLFYLISNPTSDFISLFRIVKIHLHSISSLKSALRFFENLNRRKWSYRNEVKSCTTSTISSQNRPIINYLFKGFQ